MLFEQTVLLVGRAFNSLAYQRRLKILSAPIDTSTSGKEILKEQTLAMDDIDNVYLFGYKFEEKLPKLLAVKQKLSPCLPVCMLKESKIVLV